MSLVSLFAFGLIAAPALAQDGTVATVNGQAISETAVQRCMRLQRVPPAREAEVRPAVVELLINNALVDQYLDQLKVQVEKKDVDSRIDEITAQMRKDNKKITEELKKLMFSEEEFRAQVEAELRWDKFAGEQSTEEKLKKFFEANRETFDGTRVQARHVLLPAADTQAADGAVAKLKAFKKQVEDTAAAAVAKLPGEADAFAKKKAYNEALEKEFADLARQHSTCPSKVAGGDVGWFERAHGMVEPFARAAFALEPYQISDVVKTQFGYHLILVTDRKPGHEVSFEEKVVKAAVKDVYSDRLREAVIAAMRPRAKIELAPAK
jgi:peptidyl-prolyl cis-trans isomerase C